MKKILYTLSLLGVLFSCEQKQEPAATYIPRILTTSEKFNESQEGTDSAFTIYKNNGNDNINSGSEREEFGIKFRDTIVRIQINKADSSSATDKFAYARFINTQKNTLLVHDHSD